MSSGYKAARSANKRIGQKRRQKTVARLLCGHMFLLCGAGPYVCIGWLWAWGSAICFYYAALGHMFVLVGCGRGARPYVSIMRRWSICLYWLAVGVALGHMFLLCVRICVCMCVCVCVYVCVCVTICFHSEGTWLVVVYSIAVGIKKFEITVRRSDYLVGSRPIPMEPSTGHMIKYYKYGFTWKLADFICICPYMYAVC